MYRCHWGSFVLYFCGRDDDLLRDRGGEFFFFHHAHCLCFAIYRRRRVTPRDSFRCHRACVCVYVYVLEGCSNARGRVRRNNKPVVKCEQQAIIGRQIFVNTHVHEERRERERVCRRGIISRGDGSPSFFIFLEFSLFFSA